MNQIALKTWGGAAWQRARWQQLLGFKSASRARGYRVIRVNRQCAHPPWSVASARWGNWLGLAWAGGGGMRLSRARRRMCSSSSTSFWTLSLMILKSKELSAEFGQMFPIQIISLSPEFNCVRVKNKNRLSWVAINYKGVTSGKNRPDWNCS